MGKFLTCLIFAAGAATFIYAKVGRRIGYSNSGNVWSLVGITFAAAFAAAFILFSTLVSLD